MAIVPPTIKDIYKSIHRPIVPGEYYTGPQFAVEPVSALAHDYDPNEYPSVTFENKKTEIPSNFKVVYTDTGFDDGDMFSYCVFTFKGNVYSTPKVQPDYLRQVLLSQMNGLLPDYLWGLMRNMILAMPAPKSKVTYEIMVHKNIPCLGQEANHPVTGRWDKLSEIIMNLNDNLHWSREKIANWLDALADEGKINIDIDPWEEDVSDGGSV